MNFLLATLLSTSVFNGDAFLQSSSSAIARQRSSSTNSAVRNGNSPLHGVREWRDRARVSRGVRGGDVAPRPGPPTTDPADLPLLPLRFADVLLPGQRAQIHLRERRFRLLFRDAVARHAMVGTGLRAGRGVIATVPLCEVESFTRLGADGDGPGDGAIIVTLRAVGRAKIVDDVRHGPYMKARVEEIFDEDVASLSEAKALAGNILNLMVSLASMEHKLREMEGGKEESPGGSEEQGGEATDRRSINAQLESLFAKDSVEGVDIESTADETAGDEDEDKADEDEDATIEREYDNETLDRVAQFQKAFDGAKEADVCGDLPRPHGAVDDLPRMPRSDDRRTQAGPTWRNLTAISWAAFCTGDAGNMRRAAVKLRALGSPSVLQRLRLAAAMLEAERKMLKKLQAKLTLAGIKKILDEEA